MVLPRYRTAVGRTFTIAPCAEFTNCTEAIYEAFISLRIVVVSIVKRDQGEILRILNYDSDKHVCTMKFMIENRLRHVRI